MSVHASGQLRNGGIEVPVGHLPAELLTDLINEHLLSLLPKTRSQLRLLPFPLHVSSKTPTVTCSETRPRHTVHSPHAWQLCPTYLVQEVMSCISGQTRGENSVCNCSRGHQRKATLSSFGPFTKEHERAHRPCVQDLWVPSRGSANLRVNTAAVTPAGTATV